MLAKQALGYPNSDEGMYLKCDILIPSAMENAITETNVDRINAALIVEAANEPISTAAERNLLARDIVILPDLFVNAGGVIVSYFEWVKNLTHIPFGLMEQRRSDRRNTTIADALERMTGQSIPEDLRDNFIAGSEEIELVRSGLEDVMHLAFQRMAETLKAEPELGDLRTAAYVASIRKIADAYEVIGI